MPCIPHAPIGRRVAARVAIACWLALLAAAAPARATTIVADGFESGSLAPWTVAAAGGDAAYAQRELVRSGAYAARLTGGWSTGSFATARRTLSSARTELTVSADVRIQAAAATGNVPLVRLFTASGTRLVSLFRQNGDWDRLYVEHSGRYALTSGRLTLSTWARVELAVTVAGTASTIVVKVGGATVLSTSASLGTAGVLTVQLGNEVASQPFDLVADDVTVTVPDAQAQVATSGCDPGAPTPATSDPGTVVVADNFESGLGRWTVTQAGDARATTQGQHVVSGACAGRLAVSSAWTSLANLRRPLPSGSREVWAAGAFYFEQQGVSTSWNVPTLRFFADGARVLDVSRQNGSGELFVRYPDGAGGWRFRSTGRYPSLQRWYRLKVHARANWNQSVVEVWLDGTRVFATTTATLGTGRLTVAMIGADHAGQEGVVDFDDVVIKALS